MDNTTTNPYRDPLFDPKAIIRALRGADPFGLRRLLPSENDPQFVLPPAPKMLNQPVEEPGADAQEVYTRRW